MMNKYRSLIAGVILALVVIAGLSLIYQYYGDSLPPDSPSKEARRLTGLDISDDVEVVSYEKTCGEFDGNCFGQIKMSLTQEQEDELLVMWDNRGYSKNRLPEILTKAYADDFSNSDVSYYVQKSKSMKEQKSIFLNVSRRILIINFSS